MSLLFLLQDLAWYGRTLHGYGIRLATELLKARVLILAVMPVYTGKMKLGNAFTRDGTDQFEFPSSGLLFCHLAGNGFHNFTFSSKRERFHL